MSVNPNMSEFACELNAANRKVQYLTRKVVDLIESLDV